MPAKKEKKIEIQKDNLPEKKPRRSKIVLLLVLLFLLGLLYFFRSLLIAVSVNGSPITRIAVVQELEKQYGKQALESLITETLILQEAKKQNVAIGKDEVENEVKKIEQVLGEQGQKLDEVLLLRGMTRNDLVEQITVQKMVEKMVGKDIEITDKEVNDYIEKNEVETPEGAKPEDTIASVKEQLRQQKLNEKFKTWIENLQKNAKINYVLNY